MTTHADLARTAARAFARALELAARDPGARQMLIATRTDRTIAGLQDRLAAAVRTLQQPDTTAAWDEAVRTWWDLARTETRIAQREARRWRHQGVLMEDLQQEGTLGLFEAARRYNPKLGPFPHYAGWWVRNAVWSAIRRSRRITVPQQVAMAASRRRRGQTDVGVADAVLDAVEAIGFTEGAEPAEWPRLDEEVHGLRVLRTAMAAATDEVRQVVALRLHGFTCEEAGDQLGLTKARVRRLEQFALGHVAEAQLPVRLPPLAEVAIRGGCDTTKKLARALAISVEDARLHLEVAVRSGVACRTHRGIRVCDNRRPTLGRAAVEQHAWGGAF